MIFGRWEVQVIDHRIGGSGYVTVARLHSRKRAKRRAEYIGGRVTDSKMWRSW